MCSKITWSDLLVCLFRACVLEAMLLLMLNLVNTLVWLWSWFLLHGHYEPLSLTLLTIVLTTWLKPCNTRELWTFTGWSRSNRSWLVVMDLWIEFDLYHDTADHPILMVDIHGLTVDVRSRPNGQPREKYSWLEILQTIPTARKIRVSASNLPILFGLCKRNENMMSPQNPPKNCFCSLEQTWFEGMDGLGINFFWWMVSSWWWVQRIRPLGVASGLIPIATTTTTTTARSKSSMEYAFESWSESYNNRIMIRTPQCGT